MTIKKGEAVGEDDGWDRHGWNCGSTHSHSMMLDNIGVDPERTWK